MNKIISFFVGIILFSSALVNSKIPFMIIIRNLSLFLFVTFIIFSILLNKEKVKLNKKLVLWIIFTLSVLISNIYSYSDIVYGIFLCTGVTIIYMYYLPNKLSDSILESLINNILFTESIILILSLVSTSVVVPYKGIFLNPNTLALNLLLLGVTINIKIDMDSSRNIIKGLLYKLYLLIVILLIFSTESRSSLIIILSISVFNIFKVGINKKKIIGLLLSLIMIGVVFKLYYDKNPEIINAVFKKTHNSKELFSGRGYIWRQAIKNYNILGHGNNYFENTFGLGAHNSIIKVLGENGLISAILYILLCILAFFRSIRYIKRGNQKYRFIPFYITTSYLAISMAEGLFSPFGNAYMVSFFIILGYLMNKNLE